MSDFVYVIAGGKTLEFIDLLKAEADKARQELERIAQEAGGTVNLQPRLAYGEVYPIFNFSSRPEGWALPDGVPGALRPRGDGQLCNEIDQQAKKMDIQSQFSKACKKNIEGWMQDGYSFEEIDGQTIVKCPANPRGDGSEYLVPPDSKLITLSEYTKIKEDAGLIRTAKVTTRPFPQSLEI